MMKERFVLSEIRGHASERHTGLAGFIAAAIAVCFLCIAVIPASAEVFIGETLETLEWEWSIKKSKILIPDLETRLHRAACSNNHSAWLRDGKVFVAGDPNTYTQADTDSWTDIVSVVCMDRMIAGLDSSGYVHCSGVDAWVVQDSESLNSVIHIASIGEGLVCTRLDGTIHCFGTVPDELLQLAEETADAIMVTGSINGVAVLHADRSVTALSIKDGMDLSQVSEWSDICDLSMGSGFLMGLKFDGTVLIAGNVKEDLSGARTWKNIKSISAGGGFALGLTADGKVLACGENLQGQTNTENWNGMSAIAAGFDFSVGITEDGIPMAIGYNGDGQCSVEVY